MASSQPGSPLDQWETFASKRGEENVDRVASKAYESVLYEPTLRIETEMDGYFLTNKGFHSEVTSTVFIRLFQMC